MSRVLSRLRHLFGPLLILAAALFLGRALITGWSEVKSYDWSFNLWYLGLSVVLLLLYYAQQWGGWRLIMHSFGDPLTWLESGRIWFTSILARYIPGNVAMVAGRVGMCRQRGVPGRITFASMVYENALILISALLFAAATVPLWPPFPYDGYALALAALAPVGLALLHPSVFRRLTNFAMKKMKLEPLEDTLPFSRVLLLLLYYLMGWALLGSAFAALSASVADVGWSDVALLAGGYAFAWEVGFLALITPGGLGIRELALYAILVLIFPAPVAAALVAASRLWQTLVEVAAAGTVWGITLRTRRLPSPKPPGRG